MRIIFSRKGFDSAAGKAPSPILDGRPLSLPIPMTRRSTTNHNLLEIELYGVCIGSRLAFLGHALEKL